MGGREELRVGTVNLGQGGKGEEEGIQPHGTKAFLDHLSLMIGAGLIRTPTVPVSLEAILIGIQILEDEMDCMDDWGR